MKSVLAILLLSLCWFVIFLSLGVFADWITISASAPWLADPAAFIYRHLRLSTVPFGLLILLYAWLIARVRGLLQHADTTLSQLTYYDRLLNTTISSFFGVGVIWTAIGMETALMQALGSASQGQEKIVSMGAWGLLERLVNGGLLLALSTTVFGGACGYLLGLLKILLLGKRWDCFVLQETEKHG